MLLLLLITPIVAAGLITFWQLHKESMPDMIRIAGGVEGGVYSGVSTELARRVRSVYPVSTEITSSGGSLDNRDRLLSGEIDLAPMQATAISGDLCVIAPLFYEVLYVLVKVDSDIQSLSDLRGRHVAVGPPGSGSRAVAELIFESLNLTHDPPTREVMDWQRLFFPDAPEAAMICIGRGSPLVTELLATGRWRVVPIHRGVRISLQHPTLHPMTIEADEISGDDETTQGIPTVGTTAFLAAREDTPSELVIAMLNALYAEPAPFKELIPRNQAAEWQGLALHRAARHYFSESQTNSLAP
jgi:TRAP transporter TAXI family solute receptor